MSKKCRLVTTSMAAIRAGKSQRGMMDAGLELIDSVAGYKPDLICFPEGFLRSGGDRSAWEEVNAETERRFGEKAAELGCYIMFSIYEPAEIFEGYKYNTELIYDRSGKCVLRYHKRHTVYGETTVNKVLPGREIPIAETDFGRVACLTCFDIGWRETWAELARRGAELVVWNAAYNGGNLLETYAAHNMYYVASTVRDDHAKIVDPTGMTIASSSRWNAICMADINLSTTIFHIDRQYQKIDKVRAALGDRVHIVSHGEENIFTIATNDDEWPIERICREFGLQTYKDYHAEAAFMQQEWRDRMKRAAAEAGK